MDGILGAITDLERVIAAQRSRQENGQEVDLADARYAARRLQHQTNELNRIVYLAQEKQQ